jgi:hypothetical protein
MNEDQRSDLIIAYVTETIDEMTLREIIKAYAKDMFDYLSTWSDDELEDLK